MFRLLHSFILLLAALGAVSAQPLLPVPEEPLAWDALSKEVHAQAGATNAQFVFNVTNVSPAEVTVNWVRTSCGCTVAKVPPLPWKLAPGANGEIGVAMDLRGKYGTLHKTVTIDTSHGPKFLTVKAHIPANNSAQMAGVDSRTRNMQLAMADRQIVFRNDCASCHAVPAYGKTGEALYAAACAICHDSPHRATMVPDLQALVNPPNKEYWRRWITIGRPGSLMPAFGKAEGGPLTDEQINSLVEYLTHYYPPRPTVAGATPAVED